MGGSLSRIHRDTRFSHDKWPFKAHAGNRVPHERNCDVYVPVFYIHVEPGGTFVGVGMWLPDAPMLKTIRDAIVENPTAWRSARDDRAFTAKFELGSAMLARSCVVATRYIRASTPSSGRTSPPGTASMATHSPETGGSTPSRTRADTRPFVRFLYSTAELPW